MVRKSRTHPYMIPGPSTLWRVAILTALSWVEVIVVMVIPVQTGNFVLIVDYKDD